MSPFLICWSSFCFHCWHIIKKYYIRPTKTKRKPKFGTARGVSWREISIRLELMYKLHDDMVDRGQSKRILPLLLVLVSRLISVVCCPVRVWCQIRVDTDNTSPTGCVLSAFTSRQKRPPRCRVEPRRCMPICNRLHGVYKYV